MSVDTIRVESNERVDINDFDFISESIQAHERQAVDNFLCDPARTRKWVLSGFTMDNPAAKQLRVTKGKAILAQRTGGVVEYGVITTEGDTTLTVDLNTYAPGGYGIYIRFERIAGETQSRIFWDPTGTGSEYAQSINTRYTAGWSLRVESTTPGADWLYLGNVSQATMTISDQREHYFEGLWPNYLSGWSTDGGGSANDRSSLRKTYPVTDLQMFTGAMRQCIEDIKGRGLKRWWDRDIGGMNIGFDANPVADTLAIGDADFNLDFNSGDPRIEFEAGVFFEYVRADDRLTFYNDFMLAEVIPALQFWETGGTATEKYWEFKATGDEFIFETMDDTPAPGFPIFTIARTGTVVDSMTIGATALLPGGGSNLLGDAPNPWFKSYAKIGYIRHTVPQLYWEDLDYEGATTNRQSWGIVSNAGDLEFSAFDKGLGNSDLAMIFHRTAGDFYTVADVEFYAPILSIPGNPLELRGIAPVLDLYDTTAVPADEHLWRISLDGAGDMEIKTLTDVAGAGDTVFKFERLAAALSRIWVGGHLKPDQDAAFDIGEVTGNHWRYANFTERVQAKGFVAIGDPGQVGGATVLTNGTAGVTAGAGNVLSGGNDNTGFILIHVGATDKYVATWTTIT